MDKPRHFSLEVTKPDPARTIHFPNTPERGGAPNAVLDYSDHPGYRRVDDNEPRGMYWRGVVGTFIAEHLGYDISHAWHVSSWPNGYALWVKERQGPKSRADAYLLGFGGRKTFESPREFGFHAVWLFDDNYFAAGHEACQCTLHTGRPQGEINQEWIHQVPRKVPTNRQGDGRPRGPGARANGSQRPGDGDNDIDEENLQVVRDTIRWDRSKKSLLEATGGPTLNLARPLRVATAGVQNPENAHGPPPLTFRSDELVWVSVDPVPSTIPGEGTIRRWPALIKPSKPDQDPQTIMVLLLGVNTHHIVPQSEVHPWQNKPLQTDYLQRPLPSLRGLRRRPARQLKCFRPLPTSEDSLPKALPRHYDHAILPYTIALRQAAKIAGCYTPHDPLTQARGCVGYGGFYYGPERIQVSDFVCLAPTRREFERRGIAREWLPASDGAYDRSHYALIETIRENRQGSLEFRARIFELQKSAAFVGNDDLLDPLRGFRVREVAKAQTLPIDDIARRYDPAAARVTNPADERVERRHSPTSSRRVGNGRNRSLRGVESPPPELLASGRITARVYARSREELIEGAYQGTLGEVL